MPSRCSDPSTDDRTYSGVPLVTAGLSGLRDRDDAELRRDDHLVAPARDGLAHGVLARVRAVDVGGVEQRHAEVERRGG